MANRKPWTNAEKQILVSQFSKRTNTEIAMFTGHPPGSVSALASRLGLKKKVKGVWKPWMTDFLKKNYAKTPNRLLAEWIGVSHNTVVAKATEFGLKKEGHLQRPPRKKPDGTIRKITLEEDRYIRAAISSKSCAAIARELGYAKCTVTSYCKKKGIQS